MNNPITNEEYKSLLYKVEAAYKELDIRNKEWGYALSSTQLVKGRGLIVGLNWGGNDEDFSLEELNKMPIIASFSALYSDTKSRKDLGSMARIQDYLNTYRHKMEYGQTNFCFFRSPGEREIKSSANALKLSAPIFEKLLSIIQPSELLVFSSIAEKYIRKNLMPESDTSSKIGQIKCGDATAKIFFLPHPNARIKNENRKSAWIKCFGEPCSSKVHNQAI